MSSPKTNILITIIWYFLGLIFLFWSFYNIFIYKLPQGKIDETAVVKIYNHIEIISKVFQEESQRGLQDSCQNKGQWNGLGIKSNKVCFATQDQAWKFADDWFTEKLKTHSLPESLCIWNLGPRSPQLKECINQSETYNYYRNYLLIK